MSAQIVLSISIAAYNIERYLAEALKSCCLDQNAGRFEVIVVNDGSADNTLDIAREFESRYPGTIKVIDKPNGGYGSTINAALEAATGKYFRYLDGDDWFDEKALKCYVDLLESCNDDAVYTPYVRVYEDGAPSDLRDDLALFDEGTYPIKDLKNAPHIAACSLAYRTDLLRGMGFRMTERCFYTDVEYAVLPFARVATLYVSKLPLYRYRIGREGQSVSLAGIERHYKDIVRVCARLLRELGKGPSAASEYLARCLASECATVYSFLTRIPPTAGRKADLRSFDALLSGYREVYRAAAERSRRVRLLRSTSFLAYAPLCFLSVWRER